MKSMLKLSSFFAIIAGAILVLGGLWGINFTYQNISRENIITTPDSALPNKPVRDPLTLKAQADVIRKHVLEMTNGKTYSQMPRQIAKVDENGSPILDENGKPVMVENSTRNLWVTATTLTTALNLGILTYAFSAFTILMGIISIWTGVVFFALSKNTKSSR